MTKRRFVKLLMSKGVERNNANRIAQEFREGQWPYEFAWFVLELRLDNNPKAASRRRGAGKAVDSVQREVAGKRRRCAVLV